MRLRFAPSPTGLLHLGGVRTALYNYLLAKKHNGTFILRIEDTDQTRYVEGSVENLINSLQTLGIDYDEGPEKGGNYGPYFQSQRLDLYHQHVQELIASGDAYYCFCTKDELDTMRKVQEQNKETTKYNGHCRDLTPDEIAQKLAAHTPYVVRMKIAENADLTFTDEVRGVVKIEADLVEDQVILKSDGFPTYHLACVIDDHYMQITHVIRGEEWLYSTPKHMFLYKALGWQPPQWVHLPLLLNTDKAKLSKRHGDFSVSKYLENGYLKEAIINFVALLGWHAADDREIYTLAELVQEFSLDRITKSAAVFDITKLDWLNGWYIRNLPLPYIAELCKPYFTQAGIDISDQRKYERVISRAREQITKLPDILEYGSVYYKEIVVSAENMEILQRDSSQAVLKAFIEVVSCKLAVVSGTAVSGEIDNVDTQSIKETVTDTLKEISTQLNIKGKDLYFPLRIALFGDCHGPDIPLLVDIYGVEESIKLLKDAGRSCPSPTKPEE